MRVRQTAAMEWEAFRARVVCDDTPREALIELRRVFYAGMHSGMQLIADVDAAGLDELAEEIRRFVIAEAEAERISGEAWGPPGDAA